MAKVFKIDGAGARKILRSEGVRADLQRRADRVRTAAEAALPETGDAWSRGIIADTSVGVARAGATVIGVWLPVEEEHRVLGGAIDAAG